MRKNAYLLAKIGADTAENEQHFAENLPTFWRQKKLELPRHRWDVSQQRPRPQFLTLREQLSLLNAFEV